VTTENGVPWPRKCAGWIDTLRERRDWLASRVEHGEANGYTEQELAALDWALPVLEAEHGAVLRLTRDVIDPAERLLAHASTKEQLAQFGRHAFVYADADADEPLVKRLCGECGVQFARHPGATRPDRRPKETTT
jgi:hypothetical protein